jgi:hypothetical protein
MSKLNRFSVNRFGFRSVFLVPIVIALVYGIVVSGIGFAQDYFGLDVIVPSIMTDTAFIPTGAIAAYLWLMSGGASKTDDGKGS